MAPELLQYRQSTRLKDTEGHTDAITVVAFSPNGQLLASGGLDGRICIWDVSNSKLMYIFSGKSAVLSLLWLELSRIVCGMEDGTIALLTILIDDIKIDGFLAHQYPVERLAFKANQLVSGAHEELKIWSYCSSRNAWTLVAKLDPPPQSEYTIGCNIIVTSLHWSSAPRYPSVLIATYMSHGVIAFDARTWCRIRATPIPGRIADACLAVDGRLLAVSNMLTGFEVFAMNAPAEVEPVFSVRQDVGAGRQLPVRFIHGGHALLGGTSHGQVNIWDIYSRLKQPLALSDRCSVLAISAHYNTASDSFLIATGVFKQGRASPIIIWKAEEARNRQSYSTKLEGILSARAPTAQFHYYNLLSLGSKLIVLSILMPFILLSLAEMYKSVGQ